MIKSLLFLISVLLFFSACANERGISARYYNDCEEYYDLQGHYHKKCDENIVDYKTINELPSKTYDSFQNEEKPKPKPKVW